MLMRKLYILFSVGLFSLQVFSQSVPEYCLENDAAHRYLTEVQYDPNDYTYSRIMDYCDPYPCDYLKYDGYRKDQPLPVPIKLTSALETSGTLYVSEKADYSDALVKTLAAGADSVDVYNLIPGRLYYWKVETGNAGGDAVVVESGRFKTTGQLRMLKIDNIFNVRDMGGWTGLKGYKLKYGKIIRGSRLNVNGSTTKIITDDGIKELLRVGVRAELDMRDASNAANQSYSFLGSAYPIYNVNQAYRSRIATFADAPQSIQGINKLIEWLKAGKPVYLHCSVGADRTGTVAFLVGALCGMSEDALCKEFELTSFSADRIENERDRPNPERLIRQRSYVGRLDPNDNNDSYKFASMMDKVKSFPGETIQEKVYWHLKTGVSGTAVSEADLKWLMTYMIDCFDINATTLNMTKGQTFQLECDIKPSEENQDQKITFTSSDEHVATVSPDGLITAKGGGSARITAELDGFTKTVSISIPLVESVMPDTIAYGEYLYKVTGENLIKNGSFEYGNYLANWTSANGNPLDESFFELKNHEGSDNCYLQCKADGDEASGKSIRTEWRISRNRTYVFGYRVKNSTNIKTESNPNLVTCLAYIKPKVDGEGDDFEWDDAEQVSRRAPSVPIVQLEYPSYDGEWTEIRYVFTNTEGYTYLQAWFSHLSEGGNDICLDNFYLAQVEEAGTNAVKSIYGDLPEGLMFNMRGVQVQEPGKGIIIKDGKKYLIK